MVIVIESKKYGPKKVLIDDEDSHLVQRYKWSLSEKEAAMAYDGFVKQNNLKRQLNFGG